MICFLGGSHAATHLRDASKKRGIPTTTELKDAHVVFISEDTETDDTGHRNLDKITELVRHASLSGAQLVLTSQVPPGYTRALGIKNILHQAETLRIIDAEERALNPDYIAVGGEAELSSHYVAYLRAFECPVIRMSWEEAEFSKIAVNMMLAAQVDCTNRLAAAAERVDADWSLVRSCLMCDKRIGPHSYLTPGRWQDSKHLLRDAVTLKEIEDALP